MSTEDVEQTQEEHPIFAMVRKMPEPWRSHFPKSSEEAQNWRPIVRQHALASCVLAVARTRREATWCAYIDAVPGHDHDDEADEVLSCGAKLLEEIARVLFPFFNDVPYAH
jgi:hypothetical protein